MKDVRFFRGYDIMNMQQEGIDMRILIKNASLVFEDRVEKGDLLTEGQRIVQVGGNIDAPAD